MWWPRSHCGSTTAHHSPPAETRTWQRYRGSSLGLRPCTHKIKLKKKMKAFPSFPNDMLILHDMQMKITRARHRTENAFQMEVIFLK